MDGLECSEILKTDLEFSARIDAEYYQKKYLEYEEKVQNCRGCRMDEVSDFLIGPFGSAYDTDKYVEHSEYRYIRGQDVKPFLVQDNSPKYMAKSDYLRLQKYSLSAGDILISVVGTLGNACIVRENETPAIFSCKSTAVLVNNINRFYLISYLNSEYGQKLLLRKERGAIQKGLNLDDLRSLLIPRFSESLYLKIESIIRASFDSIEASKKLYNAAEKALVRALPDRVLANFGTQYSVKKLSDSFASTGRLDAEYYQPKFDKYYTFICGSQHGFSTVENMFAPIREICDRTLKSYKYVEIGDINVGSGFATPNEVATADLPDNAKIMTKKGDIIVSTVRPNRGAVAILEEDSLLVSGAFTVLREHGTYKKEVLQVLLRTPLYRDWLLRYNVGTSYPVIKDSDVLNIPIPLFDDEIQNTVATKVQESFALRKQSEQLLECAKRVVELAIEQGEEAALHWVKSQM